MNMEEVLAANYKATTEFNPDQVAEANALSSGLQVDPRLVFEDIGLARDAAQQPNWTEYVRRAPGSAQYLSDPANMAVSRDDTQGLLSIEDVFRAQNPEPEQASKTGVSPAQRYQIPNYLMAPAAEEDGRPKDLNTLDSIVWQLGNSGQAAVIGKREAAIANQVVDGKLSDAEMWTLLGDLKKVPDPSSWFEKKFSRGLVQILEQIARPATDPDIIAGSLAAGGITGGAAAMASSVAGPATPVVAPITTGAAFAAGAGAYYSTAALMGMKADERGQAYLGYRRDGIPEAYARVGAELYSLFAVATEATEFGIFVGAARAMGVTGEAFKTALKGFIGEGLKSPGLMTSVGKIAGSWALGATKEAGVEALQQFGQDAIGEFEKYLANKQGVDQIPYKTPGELIGNAAETFSDTVLPMLALGALPAAHHVRQVVKAADEAQKFAQHHTTLNDAVQGSLTKERSPDKMEAVLGMMGLRENGYLSPEGAETLLNSLSEEEGRALASRLGIDYEKTLFDIKEGREVPLKMATLHARLSKEEFAAILPDLRPASGEFSQREAIEQGPAEEVARQVDLLVEENDAFHRLITEQSADVVTQEDPLKTTTEWRSVELNVNGETHPAGEVVDHLTEQTSELEKLVECLG